MNKSYWTGFLSGIACTLLCLIIGLNAYHIVLNQSNNRIADEVDMGDNEEGKPLKTKISTAEVVTKVNLLQNYIDTYYLKEVDGEKLEDGIFKGIVWGLADPYSVYYTKEEYNTLQESTSGVYCGIGARVSQDMETGIITIVEPFENSPAEKAGILPGDIIYKVEDEDISGKDVSEVVAKMKGKEGTKVSITLIRGKKEVVAEVTRREVENPTVKYEMLEGNVGYIKVSEFDEVTAEQFRTALKDLESKGEKGLIIDLRNNGGGRLTAVVDMLDRMLPEGIIVTTKETTGDGETYTSSNEEKFDKPLAVLINGHSASASEVFAGAIQDYGIGKLVGTTSFGKGIVQTIFGLEDGTAVKLTTAEYFTPKGRNIHGTGLEPEIKVELDKDLMKKVVIDKKDDNQLQTAVDSVLSGIKE